MLGLLRHDHAIHQHTRNLDLPRVERATLGDALHLDDHDPAGIVGGHCNRQRFQGQRLLLHGDIAVAVGRRAAYDSDVDGKRLVEQHFPSAERHQFHHVFTGARIQLAPALARVNEGTQSHRGEMTGSPSRDVAKQMRDDALGQVVGLDLIGKCQLLQLRNQAPMSADHPPDQSLVGQMVEPAIPAISLAGGIDQRQIARIPK